MLENGHLADDVDLSEIAKRAINFSGAELARLVHTANSYALERHFINIKDSRGKRRKNVAFELIQKDFLMALSKVPPALGTSENILLQSMPYGILNYDVSTELVRQQINCLIKKNYRKETEKLKNMHRSLQ